MKKARKGPKTTYDKVYELDASFVSEAYSMTADQLKKKLVDLARYASALDEAKKEDQDLASLGAQYAEAKKSYSEPLKANKLKTKLLLEIMTERGVAETQDPAKV